MLKSGGTYNNHWILKGHS